MKFALAMNFQNEEPWLRAHLPIVLEQNIFDGFVCVNGGSVDQSRFVVETAGATVYNRPFDWNFAAHGNYLLRMAEQEGYDAVLRLDPDEAMFPQDIIQVRQLLEADRCDCFSIARHNFYPDRLHVRTDMGSDPQWRAIHLNRNQYYPDHLKVHEVPAFRRGMLMPLKTVYIHHFGGLKPHVDLERRLGIYAAIQNGLSVEQATPIRCDIPYTVYQGKHVIDPHIFGERYPL